MILIIMLIMIIIIMITIIMMMHSNNNNTISLKPFLFNQKEKKGQRIRRKGRGKAYLNACKEWL